MAANEAGPAQEPGREGAPRIRIGLVCTEELRIAGFKSVLADGLGFDLVMLSAPRALAGIQLNLVLIDADATMHLFALIASFRRRRPEILLLVLGRSIAEAFVERVIAAGAKGYLSHATSATDLGLAIDVVLSGSVWAPRRVLARLIERVGRLEEGQSGLSLRSARLVKTETAIASQTSAKQESVQLTLREREVMSLLVLGHVNREIAHLLRIDAGTVKAHLARLMRKAGVTNRTALCVVAVGQGWTVGGHVRDRR